MSKFLRKAAEALTGGGSGKPVKDEDLARDYPYLHAQLTENEWSKGQVRTTSTVTVFTDDGTWKASLNNRDEGLSLFATGETMYDALRVLEELLAAPAGPPWRRSRPMEGRDGKKGKGR